MGPQPLISIYLPTHGRPQLAVRAARSVLAQSYRNFELLIVVDGRDQDAERELGDLGDPRVQVMVLPDSVGACRARNLAIGEARGEYVTGLDDDDELTSGHLAGLLAALQTSGAAFACTTSLLRRKEGDSVRHRWAGPIVLDRLLEQNVVGNQVLTRTESIRSVGGFDPEMPAWQDYDLWVRLCSTFGPGVRVDARSYILHADHDLPRITRKERIFAAHARFLQKHAARLSARQRASLELLAYATTHTRFSALKLARFSFAGHAGRALSAYALDRFTPARGLLRKLESKLGAAK